MGIPASRYRPSAESNPEVWRSLGTNGRFSNLTRWRRCSAMGVGIHALRTAWRHWPHLVGTIPAIRAPSRETPLQLMRPAVPVGRETKSSWSAEPFGKETRDWNSRSALHDFSRLGQPEVAGNRRARIVARIVAAGGGPSVPGPLCRVAADIIGLTGAGVMVLHDGVPQASLCSTGPVSALIEELQYTLGEGPCIDAYRTGTVIAEPDLATPATPRWPAFTPEALGAGARAVFGFPVRIGAARIGALNVFRDRSGPLTDDQHADALVMADVIARTILAFQAHAEPGAIAEELNADIHTVVHQAAGMVSVQLGISVGDALARLRAYAFGVERSITDVARDVVARVLHFDLLEER
jgi:hypothetical protein